MEESDRYSQYQYVYSQKRNAQSSSGKFQRGNKRASRLRVGKSANGALPIIHAEPAKRAAKQNEAKSKL
jgi:hypothetical protein